ncbi:tRNA-dihydrouridine synthase 2-like protein [Cavenderia fasciculata]|uniref:tRNA-dihydrouridine synthase n=1 Tax=Cavenderia fasciculata TaxID=261658 RepID=F4PXA4_CACFS|nr:tRNA-dihydrouridine synthase 2-like protein [Cavenderia fasciculata]EGG19907.1 tRNA-dihydrouridine synthase 2-like protein [Cavenderia fasciculata]|eukprot:XP_004366890.1 tRNA-dihydrouridine synthase 2-like protein [Cavenderia fasciculata]
MAPMVRVSTLPMRLLALRQGCDIAYSEELIDVKLSSTKRVVNEKLNTIDYISKDRAVVYRTCEQDRNNVLQLGTASSVSALKAAQHVVNDICAIDINMGCPKFFSVQGGMGSALLSKPETIKDILTTLIRNLPVPVTCKIRLLKTDQETIDLLKIIESTGVSAIGVHMREIPERPKDPAHWDRLATILANSSYSVPIIANGDIYTHQDIDNVLNQTKANSVMIARGAIRNVSVFSKDKSLKSFHQIIQDYIQIAYEKDNLFPNTKYVVNQILNENDETKTEKARQTSVVKSMKDLCTIWEMTNQYEQFLNPPTIPILMENQEENDQTKSEESSSTTTKKHTIDETIQENIKTKEPSIKRFKSKEEDQEPPLPSIS